MRTLNRSLRALLVLLLVLLLALALALAACRGDKPKFAEHGDGYATKPDLARVERDLPLTREQRAWLTPDRIEDFNEEQLEQIYARLTAGPIPDGPYDGEIIFADGGGLKRLPEILGGFKELAGEVKLAKVQLLGEALWKGKVFYREAGELRNRIPSKVLREVFGLDPKEQSGPYKGLLFPAKVYCGQSLLDGRRESIIIDYAFGDELAGYQKGIDDLAGRNGLRVRDEIRMVRPGFYLGRAYLGHVFGLWFTLWQPEVAKAGEESFADGAAIGEDCWTGPAPLVAEAR